jgi:hypothetical protein
MQCLEFSCVVRPIYGSLGAKGLIPLASKSLPVCCIINTYHAFHFELSVV